MNCRKLNLVIVDDDPSIVRLAHKVLTDALSNHLAIFPLNDSTDAKSWINTNRCDILLSDIEMPGLNGLEMLRFAKRRNSWTQVIFMTAHSTWDHVADAIEQGAIDYLLKPLRAEDLIKVISLEIERQSRWQSVLKETAKLAAAVN